MCSSDLTPAKDSTIKKTTSVVKDISNTQPEKVLKPDLSKSSLKKDETKLDELVEQDSPDAIKGDSQLDTNRADEEEVLDDNEDLKMESIAEGPEGEREDEEKRAATPDFERKSDENSQGQSEQ